MVCINFFNVRVAASRNVLVVLKCPSGGPYGTMDQPLKSGDVVEIITRRNSAPKKDWLTSVKTAGARSHIRKYLREHGQIED